MIYNFFSSFWSIMTELSLWLFFGAFIAGLLKVFLPPDFINRHMGKASLGSIIKTTLLGIPLPLCSCGVLPTAIGLKKSGANNGAAVSFLISTPQTGVDSILVTASFLGWPLALFKVLAALVTGLTGGITTQLSEKKNLPLSEPVVSDSPACSDGSCEPVNPKRSKWSVFINYSVKELIGGIYLYLIIGIFIATLVTVLFPSQLLAQYPALQGPLGMLLMLVIATPIYICTTGSVPIAASLISAGLPIGSALVFLMAGPATNAATLGAVYKSFGKKITAIYLATVVLGSMAFGLIFQNWFGGDSTLLMSHHAHQAAWRLCLDNIAAAVLSLLILTWAWRDGISFLKKLFVSKKQTAAELVLKVSGMTCNNCVAHVRHAIEHIKGVSYVDIDLKSGMTCVHGNQLNTLQIVAAVEKSGYQSEVVK